DGILRHDSPPEHNVGGRFIDVRHRDGEIFVVVDSTAVGSNDANTDGRFRFMVQRLTGFQAQLATNDLKTRARDIARSVVLLNHQRVRSKRLGWIIWIRDGNRADRGARRVFRHGGTYECYVRGRFVDVSDRNEEVVVEVEVAAVRCDNADTDRGLRFM